MRWLLLLTLLLGRAWAAGEAPVPGANAIDIPRWFTESFLEIREEVRDAARDGKRLMLYFGQDGCPYCKALMKVNFGDPAIAATTQRHFVAIALNIWGDREVTWLDGRRMPEKEVARVLGVQYTPTLLFFDEEGNVALRINGYWPPERFRRALDYVRLHKEREQGFADFEAGRDPPPAGARLASADFLARGVPDVRAALAAGKPVIALFERAGCGGCAELHREGFVRPEVRRLLQRFTVFQVDTLGTRPVVGESGKRTTERDWARALNVLSTPTLVYFVPGKGEVFRVDGYVRPFHLAGGMEYVASGAWREEPSFQRFLQRRADEIRAAGQPVELWK